jgi:signal-transduction protein with cAMP-binding, CBS, and nucleotidyltransferase domain
MISYPKGRQITSSHYDKPSDYIYFVKSGGVSILMKVDGVEYFVRTMTNGDTFGETVEKKQYVAQNLNFRAVTERVSVVLTIPKLDFYSYVHPDDVLHYFQGNVPSMEVLEKLVKQNKQWDKCRHKVLPDSEIDMSK